MLFEQLKIREIGNFREPDNRNPDFHVFCFFISQGKRVLAGQRDRKPGDDPENRYAGEFFNFFYTGSKNRGISPELVDDNPFHKGAYIIRQELDRTINLRKYTTPLDICNEDYRDAKLFCRLRICNIPVVEVQFRCSSGAFHDNLTERGLQPFKGFQRFDEKFRRFLVILSNMDVLIRSSVKHNLRDAVPFWLEEDRVHVSAGRNFCSHCLHRLCHANLSSVRCDIGVQAHILGLEGGDTYPAADKAAADGRNGHALSNMGR